MPNLYSADVSAAASFYAELLGFSQTFQYPAAGPAQHVELRLGDSMLAISNHAAVARVRSAGAPVLVEPYDHVAGHRRAYVTDPDGNWLAFVQGH